MFHWVCEEGGKWQAYTSGLLLRSDAGMPSRAVGIKYFERDIISSRTAFLFLYIHLFSF